MKTATLTFILILLLTIAGCAVPPGQKGQTGAFSGAIGGALIGQAIGHDTESTLIGAAVGTMLGYIVGNEMDKYDRQQLNHVYERGVSGQPSSWINPDSGNQYRVIPQPAYNEPVSHGICRKAEIVAWIDGQQQKTYTTACRDAQGRWILQR